MKTYRHIATLAIIASTLVGCANSADVINALLPRIPKVLRCVAQNVGTDAPAVDAETDGGVR